MFKSIVIGVWPYNMFEFDRKNLEEKCPAKQDTVGIRCDCWYTAERFDTKYNGGKGNNCCQLCW